MLKVVVLLQVGGQVKVQDSYSVSSEFPCEHCHVNHLANGSSHLRLVVCAEANANAAAEAAEKPELAASDLGDGQGDHIVHPLHDVAHIANKHLGLYTERASIHRYMCVYTLGEEEIKQSLNQ